MAGNIKIVTVISNFGFINSNAVFDRGLSITGKIADTLKILDGLLLSR